MRFRLDESIAQALDDRYRAPQSRGILLLRTSGCASEAGPSRRDPRIRDGAALATTSEDGSVTLAWEPVEVRQLESGPWGRSHPHAGTATRSGRSRAETPGRR